VSYQLDLVERAQRDLADLSQTFKELKEIAANREQVELELVSSLKTLDACYHLMITVGRSMKMGADIEMLYRLVLDKQDALWRSIRTLDPDAKKQHP
jgi:hypothetical protein